jgi:RNA recognition motif-containing protein
MSYTVFLGNLPVWVTKDDIKSWLNSENLVYDDVKVIRNPETQESKGFAFIDTPNSEEMQSIIRRFDRAPLEDRLLRANQAQPPKQKAPIAHTPSPRPAPMATVPAASAPIATTTVPTPVAVASTPVSTVANDRGPRRERGGKKHKRTTTGPQGQQSAFAEELAKAL